MSRRSRRARRQGPVEREGGRAVLLVVLVVLVLAGSGYVAAYAGADGKLPTGTRVGGVDVGGRDPQQAAHVLAVGLASRLAAPITLSVGDRAYQATPADAGLSVDYLGSVERALGRRSWDPDHLWNYYTGGGDFPVEVSVDESRMGALLDQLDQQLGTAPRNGGVSLASGSIQVVQPRAGATIDHPAALTAIRSAWSQGRSEVALPLQVTQPTVTAAQVQAAVTNLVNPALAAPVVLHFDRSRVTLSPHDYAPMLTLVPRGGQLALDVVGSDLARLVDPAGHDTTPRDATVRVRDGAVRVVRARSGHAYDAQGVAAAFLSAVVASGEQRTVTVVGDVTPATFTTHDAKALGVTTPVATYSVTVPRSAGSSLSAAVSRLSGTLVRPGATFSLAQTVGDAGSLGSRLATATWNAGFLAGMSDVARTAPTTSAPSSPVGRDATIGDGADLQLRDDGPYGVLLSARLSGRTLTVDAWSTPQYVVTASVGAPYAVVPRSSTVDTGPACRPSTGSDGFTVDLSRTVASVADPSQTRSDVVTTTYQPTPAVVCAAAPAG